MTSSIGSSYGSMQMMHRPDPTQMASKLFSKLDTKNQGYIEKSDLQSAFAQISGSSSSDTGVDEVFKQLDGDGDGKITQDEMTSGFKKLTDELDSQFNNMRMNGHGGHGHHGGMEGMAVAGGMPPPPPQGTQDSGSSSSSTSGTASADSDERKVMHRIMQLMHAYGGGQDAVQSGVASLLSASA